MKSKDVQQRTTMAGTFETTRTARVTLKLQELIHTAEISANYVTKQKSTYDIIFGRKSLKD